MSFVRALAIAKNTLKEAVRQPVIILIIALLSGAVFFSQFVTFFSLGEEARMLRDTCLASITVGGLLVAVFASASVISDEIEKKTAMTVLCKPVSRAEFIFGKYLGILLTLAVAYAVFFVVFCFTIWCNESPVVQGLFGLWWRNAPITQGRLAAWLGEEASGANEVAGGWAVVGALAANAVLFVEKMLPDLVKALVLSFAEVSVLAAAAVAASTRLPTAVNAALCGSFFVLGHIQSYLVRAFYPVDDLGRKLVEKVDALSLPGVLWHYPAVGIAKVLHAILPDLESFNYSAQIAFDLPKFEDVTQAGVRVFGSAIPTDLMLQTVLYGILYAAALVLLAILSFRTRELT